jgi:hypothetical protein
MLIGWEGNVKGLWVDEEYVKKKPFYIKNQGWEPTHQKYKANESMNKRNPQKN